MFNFIYTYYTKRNDIFLGGFIIVFLFEHSEIVLGVEFGF